MGLVAAVTGNKIGAARKTFGEIGDNGKFAKFVNFVKFTACKFSSTATAEAFIVADSSLNNGGGAGRP
jgi:hypothetical protein